MSRRESSAYLSLAIMAVSTAVGALGGQSIAPYLFALGAVFYLGVVISEGADRVARQSKITDLRVQVHAGDVDLDRLKQAIAEADRQGHRQ